MIVDEQIRNACEEPHQMSRFADVTIEAHPMVISNFQVPEVSGDFCSRAGRFGTHASNESMAPIFCKKIVFLSYFTAGVRALDVRDPYHPKEVGYFIPTITEATDKRCTKVTGQDSCKIFRLHCRSGEYRHAHPRTDRAGPRHSPALAVD